MFTITFKKVGTITFLDKTLEDHVGDKKVETCAIKTVRS